MLVETLKPQSNRFIALEGVRGLAALVVVLHHFILAFYPSLVFGPNSIQHMRFEDNIFGSPLSLFYAGTFAVAIFFVLSGFVLTIGFFQTKDESVIKRLATKRYLRLMIPALAITLVCFALIKLGAAQIIANTFAITQSVWLNGVWNFDTSFFDALYSGSVGVFIESGSVYNNVLWTMFTEFMGSFMVFAFILVFGKSRHRWVSYSLLAVITFNSWFLPFVIGMALADLYSLGYVKKVKNHPRIIYALVFVVVILGAFPYSGVESTYYNFLNISFINAKILYFTIAATSLILIVLVSKRLSDWLERPRVSILGKYTFSLYLVHVPILYTLVFAIFLLAYPLLGYNLAVTVALIAAIIPVSVITFLFEKYVDAPAVRFSKLAAEIYESDKKIKLPKLYYLIKRRVNKFRRTLGYSSPVEENLFD